MERFDKLVHQITLTLYSMSSYTAKSTKIISGLYLLFSFGMFLFYFFAVVVFITNLINQLLLISNTNTLLALALFSEGVTADLKIL